jgi:NAD(P)-dependent dehydrogenase (short-subunit alcohol dehydrogenase family)
MGLLDEKVVLVTGAGGGLGRGYAKLLAAEGAAVVVNDLGGDRDGTGSGSDMADGVVKEIKDSGGKAVANYGSVSNKEDAQRMVRAAVDEFGKLDVLINNAGILRDKSFKNITDEMWEIVLNVHLHGTYLVTKAAYDQMLAQETGGRILMTSSTSGLLGNFGQTNYGAAKAGMAGFMRCLALEGIKYGVTVNLLAPNAYSRLTEDLIPAAAAEPLAPEKVAPAVVWLCSDEARDITGRIFAIGGNTVALLAWQAVPIAKRSPGEEPWEVADIGNRIRESVASWPQPITLQDLA